MSKKNDEMMTGVKVQKSRTDKIFDFFLYTISTIIVIVMLYPFVQKYFISGITVGAVKG
jgi:putative aldouronate transport system permease protein